MEAAEISNYKNDVIDGAFIFSDNIIHYLDNLLPYLSLHI